MEKVQGFYQTAIQHAIGVKQKLTGAASTAQNNALHIMQKSYAEPLVQLSGSTAVDDRKNHLAETLKDYAKNYEKASLKDKNKINSTMVKLFQKMAIDRDPNTAAQDKYYHVKTTAVQSSHVTPDAVHDHLMKTNRPQDHPRGISGVAFAFAAILALTLHREDTSRSELRNKASPYFDLSPLYGTNKTETDTIRLRDGTGMLWPDSFAEDEKRLAMLPDSVPALLVLWNRYHNYVAKQLFSRKEKEWKDPAVLSLEDCLVQDDQIFDIARSITAINFMNVVQEDFVKGLIGMSMAGPSARLDVLHDVRGITSYKTGYFSTIESYLLYSFSAFAPPSFASTVHERMNKMNDASADFDVRRRNRIGDIFRNKRDCFEDNDLAELLVNATETNAGSPGGRSVPDWAREWEIQKIKHAQEVNVCTLNEFRRHLGLKQLGSFQEWNPDLAHIASGLYGDDINKLELYPGLVCERSTGSGFGFGYTMTWGLIADIVTRIRSDPVFTSNFNEHVLTKWGYGDCISTIEDTKESNSSFYSSGGSLGGMLPKLLQRTLPHTYAYDNIYSLFPLVVPEKSKEYVNGLDKSNQKKYKINRPAQAKIKIVRTLKGISEVLNDPVAFPSPYKQNLIELTGGYGHMLGFDDLTLHDRDLMMTLFSLMPDKGAVRRIGASFAQKAQENLRRRVEGRGTKDGSIDVIRDVIDATCIRWVCETIYTFDFPDNSSWGMTEEQMKEAREKSRQKELEERKDFAAYYAYIFRNAEPEFGWNARERALTASQRLRKQLMDKLPRDNDGRPGEHYGLYTVRAIMALWGFFNRIAEEYAFGKMLPQHSALTFLDRMMKASQIKPLKRLADSGHLKDAKQKCKEEVQQEVSEKNAQKLVQRVIKEGYRRALFHRDEVLEDQDAEEIARQRLEEQRVVANVIGLAIVICVHFSKVCAQAIDFYLDDRRTEERKKLVALCKDENSSNKEIMGYIWEAQRIGQRFGLWRYVNNAKRIDQGFGYPVLNLEPGDRVFADFTFAHNDPKQFTDPEKEGTNPEKVNPNRNMNSLLGLGVHKCPAGSFIDQTMSQIIRVIFKQEGLKRADGKKGQLKSTTLHPDAAPWDSEIYLDEDGGFSHYPTQMILEFDASNLKDEPFVSNGPEWKRLYLDRACSALIVLLILFFILSLFTSISLPNLSFLIPRSGKAPVGNTISCGGGPFPPAKDWQIEAFRPKYFGLFGEPEPITFRTPRGRMSHRVSLVDIDKRDIEIRVWLDDGDRGHRDVDLDPTADCGDDISKCLGQGFAAAVVVAPPGRHTVKAEIKKRNESEAFVWGKERQRRIKWVMQPCT